MTAPADPHRSSPAQGSRFLAWALAAGALMSGLNAAIQVARLLVAVLRHAR